MTTLPWHCLSVPGCDSPRLPYAGHCRDHGPSSGVNPEPRCVDPLRCYCVKHLGRPVMLGPHHTPESIRLMLDELARRRAAGSTRPVLSVVPSPSR